MTAEAFIDGRVTLHVADVRAALDVLPPDSVDCVVTSPPYWGLRDYGFDGQIGCEPTLGEHLAVLVDVFDRVRRVLKPAGTLWLNYGDCYAALPNGRSADAAAADGLMLKPKDLCMAPNRLAIALQESGWWVRAECIWAKPNPMPDSSGAYRPATAHEKIFLLVKDADAGGWWMARDTGEVSDSPDMTETCHSAGGREVNRWRRLGHYYNARAVRLAQAPSSAARLAQDIGNQTGSFRANGGAKTNGPMKAVGIRADKQRGHSRRHQGFNERWDAMERADQIAGGRNLRNYEPAPLGVWAMATEAFTGAHFATFPRELAARCIEAGCPPGGHVLDPFGGSGTTALVATQMGRTATLIEASPEYAAIARERIERAHLIAPRAPQDAGPLFNSLLVGADE